MVPVIRHVESKTAAALQLRAYHVVSGAQITVCRLDEEQGRHFYGVQDLQMSESSNYLCDRKTAGSGNPRRGCDEGNAGWNRRQRRTAGQ